MQLLLLLLLLLLPLPRCHKEKADICINEKIYHLVSLHLIDLNTSILSVFLQSASQSSLFKLDSITFSF